MSLSQKTKNDFKKTGSLYPRSLILGDNKQVLADLVSEYKNKVDLIYIDPPYNRGDDFKFYQDTKNHDEWLNEIESTISLLKDFLKDNGSMWISIDDSEMAYLKVCCDKVFGRKNFVSTIVWQKRNTRENRNTFSNNHEYILVYSKNDKLFKKKRNLLPPTKELLKRYKNPDNDPRGDWQSITLSVQAGHAVDSQFYPIFSPSGKVHHPPQGRCWIYNEDRMIDEIKKNNIWFGVNGDNVPRKKKFLFESKVGIVPETLWNVEFAGSTKDGKQELLNLDIYDEHIFDTPKPEKLISNILKIATNENDLVLDCFLGSGTSSAVAHKLGRNYIGIEIDENTFKYANKRMESVCKGDSVGISSNIDWGGGGDYQVYNWN